MGQPKPPTTEIKPEKPTLFTSNVPLYVQQGLGEALTAQQARADYSEARRSRAIDSLLGRPETPLTDYQGNVIDPNVLPKPFDPGVFYDPGKNTALKQTIDEYVKKDERRDRRKERSEEMDREMENIFGMSRAGYLAAMNRVANQGKST
jgi:hypothetical protein